MCPDFTKFYLTNVHNLEKKSPSIWHIKHQLHTENSSKEIIDSLQAEQDGIEDQEWRNFRA